jgi:hypothetical protein
MNLPSGIVPVTQVQKGEDHYNKTDSIHRDFLFRFGDDAM